MTPAACIAGVALALAGSRHREAGDEQDPHRREQRPTPAGALPTILPKV